MKYFTNCKTLDELKAEYRRLAMANHPDRGGDVETMKQINADHDAAFEILKNRHNASADEFHQTTETAEEFRDPFARTVRHMDRNEDGVIDRNDFRRRHHDDGDREQGAGDDNG